MLSAHERYEKIKLDLGHQRLSMNDLMSDKYAGFCTVDRLSLVVKVGDSISFRTHSTYEPALKGVVEFINQLGYVVYVDNVQYELKKLLDIEVVAPFQT